VHTYAKAGTYSIALTATNPCTASKVTRNVQMISTSAKDIFEQLNAEIQPNPNDGNFDLVVDNQAFINATLKVTDVAGKVLWSKNTALETGNQRIKINAPTLSQGLYFLQIESKERKGSLKFVRF
jgi:PKD repeat protein